MPDILSQDEIDALLNAVTSGAIDAMAEAEAETKRGYTHYDFKRPKLISKDQKRTMQMLYDAFAKSYATSLSLYLRTNVSIDLTLIEQFTYGEYIMSRPETTCLNLFSMAPVDGFCVFEINLKAVFAMVDRLMGGPGNFSGTERELTAVEKTIISKVAEIGLEKMVDAWHHILELDCRIEGMESRPQFTQIVGLTNNVLLIQFSIEIGTTSAAMSICIPFDVVIPILGKLTAQQWMASSMKAAEKDTTMIRQQLPSIEIEVAVELGHTDFSIRELVELRQNDVVLLSQAARDPSIVSIGGVRKFLGKPGVVANKRAVLIQQETE